MPRKETYAGPLSAETQQNLVSEGIENFELPKSVVMKIAKSAVRNLVVSMCSAPTRITNTRSPRTSSYRRRLFCRS